MLNWPSTECQCRWHSWSSAPHSWYSYRNSGWWSPFRCHSHPGYDAANEDACLDRLSDEMSSCKSYTETVCRPYVFARDSSMHPSDGNACRSCCTCIVVRRDEWVDADRIRIRSRISCHILCSGTAVRRYDTCECDHLDRAEWWSDGYSLPWGTRTV